MSVLLVQGTALHIPLRDASVHTCVTSPPYYSLRDYGTGYWTGGDPACTHTRRTSTKEGSITTESRPTNTNHELEGWRGGICGRCGAMLVDQQLGLEPTIEAYLAAMVQVFREVRRVLREDGTCWINMGDSFCNKQLHGLPWRLAFALQADGWILRSELIWHKLNPMPESVQDRPTRAHEQVFLFAKQDKYYYDGEAVKEPATYSDGHNRFGNKDAQARCVTQLTGNMASHAREYALRTGRAMRSVLSLASEPCSFAHFATFPTALVRKCLLVSCSAHGVCRACQSPWRRQREVVQSWRDTAYVGAQGYETVNRTARVNSGGQSQSVYTSTDWSPTCTCGAPGDGTSVVLDPFCGSATTVLVARELGHHGVGLDLSDPYLHDIARQRLGLAQLAAWQGETRPAPTAPYTDLPLFAAGD